MQFTLMCGGIDVEEMDERAMPDGLPWYFGRIIIKGDLDVTPKMFSVKGTWFRGYLYMQSSESSTTSTTTHRYLFGDGDSRMCVVVNMRNSSIRWKYL